MNRYVLPLIILTLLLSLITNGKIHSGFAIVVDKESFAQAKNEIGMYARAVENEGLKTYIIVDRWQNPDSIRMQLIKLFHSQIPLEGVVFVGDIPVPMIRDAQHLSTAFKMDQERYAWNRSSIPSDRFYEDFDLDFKYLKHDTVNPLYFYYSLKASSPQRLTPDIYSARIKPPQDNEKYEKLKNYLRKVSEYKYRPGKAKQILYFTGHGYNSECPRTWMDEKLALYQQFNYLNSQGSFLEYINFQEEDHIKFRLLSELKRKDLDIALLHHHGAPDAQLLDGNPMVRSIPDEIADVKFYLRSKLRSQASTPEEIAKTKANYQKTYGVPDNWFNGTFDKDQILKDSIFTADLDISLDDLKGYKPGAKFIMLDACFNGSFHLNNYQAAQYLFSDGQTMVVQANSVNIYQDKWPDEMVGLMGLGLRAGFWNKMNCTLETHLFGDPTFCFEPADPKLELNNQIIARRNDSNFWKKQLNSEYADVRALALRMLYDSEGEKVTSVLLDRFKNSGFFTERTEAFKLLGFCRDENFNEAIDLGINDSYELIQRFSALAMADNGDPKHIPSLIGALLRNNVSKRVEYNLKNAIDVYDKDILMAELKRQIPGKEFLLDPSKTLELLSGTIEYEGKKMKNYVDEITDPETKIKEKIFDLKTFRNQNAHQYLEKLIQFTDTTSNYTMKLTGIEMLGWFDKSYKRSMVSDFCERELLDTSLNEACRNELMKTMNRVK